MYIVQNLKSSLYGIVSNLPASAGSRSANKITWHSLRDFATWFETKQDAEDALERIGVDRDQVRIIKVS